MTALKAAMEKAMSKLNDGDNKLDEIAAYATSIRAKIIPDVDVFTGMSYVIQFPAGSMIKDGKDVGGFSLAFPEDEGRRIQKWMKETRTHTTKLQLALEDNGYVRLSKKL